jgi:glutamate-5-semialdehyde dehydrogenase
MTTDISPRVTRGVTRIVAAAKESAGSIAQASTELKNAALAAK